jgi:hypothetical protein
VQAANPKWPIPPDLLAEIRADINEVYPTGFVSLSARYSWRKRLGWRVLGLRERVALWLAPWLDLGY